MYRYPVICVLTVLFICGYVKARAVTEAVPRVSADRAVPEAEQREVVDIGYPFGEVYLVDEIDCGAVEPGHRFEENPAGCSRVETILGRSCRVLNKVEGEASYISFRIGEGKRLAPGAAYVLEIAYPEDKPRTLLIRNDGCEVFRGFHTGATLGDALHQRYVDNLVESIAIPLSGEYESARMYFRLHDRFPVKGGIRGGGPREFEPADGFTVAIAQFSAKDMPMSAGAAVAEIRLYMVPEPEQLKADVNFPPAGLPRRHLFWREEMSDGILETPDGKRGVSERLDWYRYKADLMHLLAMNTYSKDLLEFGACQHWNPIAGGGNDWVYFNAELKDLWRGIVELMAGEGFDILPYYEYSGSKGKNGLGFKRRARPLTRDDAYTHIEWIETANADITDPDTYEDFKKMLKLTILRYADEARFVGAWIRPRSQLPIGFGDETRRRFAAEVNDDKPVTKAELAEDAELLQRYYHWWYGKRRQFLVAMRDYLRESGVPDAMVLFTACAAEPGVSFPEWDRYVVTGRPDVWERILSKPEHNTDSQSFEVLSFKRVIDEGMYEEALTAMPPTWGGWEVHHANMPPDPLNYKDTGGVLMTHAFNRAYTVGKPETFNTFRGPSGLAIIRHYSLNEDMMFDSDGEPKLGYFVCDIERAGPYCMLAEARAVANGDPTMIGYLAGNSFTRSFPAYARRFNMAFLSLPALPSVVVGGACDDNEIVIRKIKTREHGVYYSLVNTGLASKNVTVELPGVGRVFDAATGEPVVVDDGKLSLDFYPCELKALRVAVERS
ncbi:MAG: hypothetical protein K9N48_08595 [Verrucomicrobia bacterium]|nr:hypothetical protein [Verrucomicrobiota bacterium]MCF7707498.1 hypothetical protein [Verrucomicrobiota bacterium]